MDNFISKKQSTILKGIAIVFMVIHHFFTYPEWYKNIADFGMYENVFSFLCEPFRLCVPIFAILTGYAYSGKRDLSLKKSMKKIISFLISYWIIYLLLVFVATVICKTPIDWFYLSTGLLGVTKRYAIFCWYVYFFVSVMISLPLLRKIWKKGIVWCFLTLILCRIGVGMMLNVHIAHEIWIVIYDYFYYLSAVTIGFMIGEWNIFSKISKIGVFSGNSLLSKVLLVIIGVGSFLAPAVIGIEIKRINVTAIYAAVLIYCIVAIQSKEERMGIFEFFGKHATNIWFLHCIFFADGTERIFKRILYWPHYPVLIFVWGMTLCVLLSYCVIWINQGIKKYKTGGIINDKNK
ncbi:MAG: acyltransferase [Lachnospiraceae bacterium]|nr:acyltransferase [Lachnospiraceae bacterium]